VSRVSAGLSHDSVVALRGPKVLREEFSLLSLAIGCESVIKLSRLIIAVPDSAGKDHAPNGECLLFHILRTSTILFILIQAAPQEKSSVKLEGGEEKRKKTHKFFITLVQ
jgi:hypothetical protein